MGYQNIQSFVQEGLTKLRNDYDAGKMSRFRRSRPGVGVVPRHADWHTRMDVDFWRMLELNRDYDRNDPIIGQGITRVVDNLIQDGITPDARTPDAGLNKELNARWSEEATSEHIWDVQEECGFHDLERDVTRATLVDGDMCAVYRNTGQVELMEAHRLRTPMKMGNDTIRGIRVNPATRKRLGYYFCQEDVNPFSAMFTLSQMEEINPRDEEGYRQLSHIYFRKRVSQTRGISCLAPITDIVSMHGDLQFATLVKAQVASCFAVFREMAVQAPGPYTGATPRGPVSKEDLFDGSSRSIEGLAPGMELQGRPGEKLQGFAPNIPNPEHFPHSILLLTFISCNLGLPIATLLLDPQLAGNFSSLRGVWDQAKIGMRKLQYRLVARFHAPVREFRLRHWASQNDAMGTSLSKRWDMLGPSFFACRWRFPRWPYIEPITDAASAILRTRNLLISPRRGAAECGDDWEDIVNETIEDNTVAIMAAMESAAAIRKKFKDEDVSWREVLSLPTPDRVSVAIPGGTTSETPEPVQPAVAPGKKPATKPAKKG